MILRNFYLAFVMIFCTSFSTAFDLVFWHHIPKAELHLHLGGSYPIEYLLSIADLKQQNDLQDEITRIGKSVPYHECFNIFGIISKIVNSEEKVERGVEALCHSLEEDGVIYAEIRTGLKDFGNGYEEYLKAVIRGIQKGCSNHLQAKLLLSVQRSSSLDYAKVTSALALKYRDHGVVGIDISGNSTIGEIQSILPEILKMKDEGLFLTLHIGESPDEKGQVELLEALCPDRVGHGVYLEPEAQNWIVENKVPLEVCLTSSLLVQMIDQPSNHPGLQYFLQKHPIVICTDDPLIFQTSLSQEYKAVFENVPISLEELSIFSQNSINYSFANERDKESLRSFILEWYSSPD